MNHRPFSEVQGNTKAEKMLTLIYEALLDMPSGCKLLPTVALRKDAAGNQKEVPVIVITEPDGRQYLIDWQEDSQSLHTG